MKEIKKITLSREVEAHKEMARTRIPAKLARGIVVVFLALLVVVPIIDLFFSEPMTFDKESSKQKYEVHGYVSSIKRWNRDLIGQKKELEQNVEEHSVLREVFVGPFQEFLTTLLHSGNEKVVVGRDGWLFYQRSIDYLTAQGIDTVSISCIIDFDRQLKARGIELIVVPIPAKPQIYPEKLNSCYEGNVSWMQNNGYAAWLGALRHEGVRILDYSSQLWQMKQAGKPVFLRSDTHWQPNAMEGVAQQLAKELKKNLNPANTVTYRRESHRQRVRGDIYTMLKMPFAPSYLNEDTVTIHPICNERGEYWLPSKESEVLLLGDSFSSIYSLAEMGWGNAAGFAEQLSYYLQQPIDALRRNGEGGFTTRKMLQTELSKGRDYLEGKKVVVWEFAMRELTQSRWAKLEMKKGDVPEQNFLTLAKDAKITVTGTIADRSASPSPNSVTYADHVIALHLTDIQREDGTWLGKDAMVYLLGMRSRRLTAAASLRRGERISICLESWLKHENVEGMLNRNELEDVTLQLQEPVWGVLVEKP